MSAKRMSREEFFAKLAPLGEDRLRKVLWNLYWRGSILLRNNAARLPRRNPQTQIWCRMRSASSPNWRERVPTSPEIGGCRRRSGPASG